MPIIEAKNLEKIYEGEAGAESTPALKGATLNIGEGEFVAIMGPSGSGKSTLLHILGFLDRQSGGNYKFNGKTIDELDDSGLAKVRNNEMGFVFQSFNLLPKASVLENVMLPLMYSGVAEGQWKSLATEAIDAVGLSHRTNHLASQLSGGEKQRAAIARALVMKPKVIFADEPTGNLDSKSGQAVMQIIQDLNENHGHTIVLITHETYTAEHAQRIVRLRDGVIESDEKVNHRHKANEYLK